MDTCHAVYLPILKTLCIIRNYVGLDSPLMNKSFNREHVLRRSFIGVSIRQILLLAMTLAVTHKWNTAWKVSKYGVFSCPYFSIFGLNTGKYGPEKLHKLRGMNSDAFCCLGSWSTYGTSHKHLMLTRYVCISASAHACMNWSFTLNIGSLVFKLVLLLSF